MDVRQRCQSTAHRIEQRPEQARMSELEGVPKLLLRPSVRLRYRPKGQEYRTVGEIGARDDVLDAVENDGASGIE